ncbi:TetR/AcrR family transcriptional regulator [Rhodococcus chondri]|uniref:TetR/AcrR family transcriptional regulator n=1 Tax=Rhodococcus chondri TaxID=3065941 RepID=A0ABU7JZ21_9NOCA|nr:TetR/AcrR family transcriptional regulator [Rhodococcus sp. CC-R104]MEE2034814.1 TetR/AcrR family transcriptional regulator [Rhodococcus sp. CC-R104]
MTEAPPPRRRGRPRDADLEDRVFDAVLEVYSETSWRGFTLDAVGRRARVGRAALYRRWNTKDELLVQALEARSPLPVPIDTGALRSDLVELAKQLLSGYRTTSGLVSLRVALDARVNPELLARLTATLNRSRVLAARTIVHRAVERNELPAGTSVTLLLEMVTGAVLSHALFALTTPAPADDDTYAEMLVEATVHALRLTAPASEPKTNRTA